VTGRGVGKNAPMTLSFFTSRGDDLMPADLARSLWSEDQMHGVALSGALARALERQVADLGRDDLRPARYTVDLFRPARMELCRTTTRVVREGKRLCLVDAVVEQDGEPVARASALFLKVTEPVTGDVWEPAGSPEPPSLELAPVSEKPRVPLFSSDGVWDESFAAHQNGSRKATWQVGVAVVPEEVPSGFVVAASVADSTSMVTNWGSNGVEYINTDITLTLSRLPQGREIGLSAIDRVSHDGIAVGTATVFDRNGRIGTAVTTAIANAKRAVDFEVHDFTDDPRAS
jgi:acyl-coenzyme A thioesterase PaaI-like protein